MLLQLFLPFRFSHLQLQYYRRCVKTKLTQPLSCPNSNTVKKHILFHFSKENITIFYKKLCHKETFIQKAKEVKMH